MASAMYTARTGTYEEFMDVFDPETDDVTAMLREGLINPDPEARAKIANDMLDRGADAASVEYGNSTLALLLGGNERLGKGDGALAKRLVASGADVNRRSRGDLPLRLAITIDADDDEERREVYEALFGFEDLDLSLPSSERNPINTIAGWLRMNIDGRPGKLDVLDEFLKESGY